MLDNAEKMQLINDLMHAIIMRERERCAKIADDYAAANEQRKSSLPQWRADIEHWGVHHAVEIAKLIRGET